LKSVFASDRDGRMVGMVQFLDYGDARLTCEARNIDEASRSGAARRAGRVSPWSWCLKPGKNGCASKQIGVTVQADHPARVRTIHRFPSSETWPSHVPPGEGASGSLAFF